MNIALLLSGGTGVRLGSNVPKQYIEIAGRPVFSWCLETLAGHEDIDGIQIVADPSWHQKIESWWNDKDKAVDKAWIKKKIKGFSLPGENRQMSIYHGLLDIHKYAGDKAYILIHDAARPCLSPQQVTDCLKAAAGRDGTMPALPMKDTVYSSLDGKTVSGLLERRTIYAGQAPEVFLLGKYLQANENLLPDRILAINGSAEPAVVAGMDIAMIPGDEGNFKITTKADLERFAQIVSSLP